MFITLGDNGAFFSSAYAATVHDEHQLGIVLSLWLLFTTILVFLLSLAIGKWTLRSIAAVLLITGAAAGYFMSSYGVIFDSSMIRNIAETDAREASPMLTSSFLVHVSAFGIAPSVLIFLIPFGGIGWWRELAVRLSTILCSGLLLCVVLYANYGPVSFFAQQNHMLRMQMNPVYPLYSLYRYATRANDKPLPVREPIEASRSAIASRSGKPALFVFVMGETARADRFSLNGYLRDTNRFTRELDVVNFSDVSSCGTSTADSVPCIFSPLGREEFSHSEFAARESLYQTLGRLGIDVAWRDNSTGCKHVCDPETYEALAGATDPDLCSDDVCLDEILLGDMQRLIHDGSQDHFIVLHQRGSHGPAYFRDTPTYFKTWLPECDSPGLQNCDDASINNAYDNTILYTDYFLSRIIALLERESGRYETALFYVSDHGESLGENGLYLHGLPYALAPAEQTRVPMIFWASPGFYASRGISLVCLRDAAKAPTAHDAVFHSILALFDIASPAYEAGLDPFSGCRTTSKTDFTATARGA